jgi:hypothetical protein
VILRGLVVFLACLNLGVGLWWLMHRDPVEAPPPALEAGTGSLVLLGEAELPPPPDQAEVGAVPVPMPAAPACYSLGAFSTPAELRVAMNALTPHVARIQFREVASTELRGYRVYLPAAGSREEALATARQLAARGVRDYYVVTAGAQENTVSLGLFRDLGNAETRRDELAALGFQPVLEPRTSAGTTWWIDFAAEPDFDWKARLANGDGLEATPVACEG